MSTSKITGGAKSHVGGLLSFKIRHDNHLEVSLRFKEHNENVFGCIASVKIKISRQENQLFHEEKIHIVHSFLKFSKNPLSTSKITGGAKRRVGGLLNFRIRHCNYLKVSPGLKEHAENILGPYLMLK